MVLLHFIRKWLNKMWYIYPVEYHAVMKKTELVFVLKGFLQHGDIKI